MADWHCKQWAKYWTSIWLADITLLCLISPNNFHRKVMLTWLLQFMCAGYHLTSYCKLPGTMTKAGSKTTSTYAYAVIIFRSQRNHRYNWAAIMSQIRRINRMSFHGVVHYIFSHLLTIIIVRCCCCCCYHHIIIIISSRDLSCTTFGKRCDGRDSTTTAQHHHFTSPVLRRRWNVLNTTADAWLFWLTRRLMGGRTQLLSDFWFN